MVATSSVGMLIFFIIGGGILLILLTVTLVIVIKLINKNREQNKNLNQGKFNMQNHQTEPLQSREIKKILTEY